MSASLDLLRVVGPINLDSANKPYPQIFQLRMVDIIQFGNFVITSVDKFQIFLKKLDEFYNH